MAGARPTCAIRSAVRAGRAVRVSAREAGAGEADAAAATAVRARGLAAMPVEPAAPSVRPAGDSEGLRQLLLRRVSQQLRGLLSVGGASNVPPPWCIHSFREVRSFPVRAGATG